jgi:hypothetical protein
MVELQLIEHLQPRSPRLTRLEMISSSSSRWPMQANHRNLLYQPRNQLKIIEVGATAGDVVERRTRERAARILKIRKAKSQRSRREMSRNHRQLPRRKAPRKRPSQKRLTQKCHRRSQRQQRRPQ